MELNMLISKVDVEWKKSIKQLAEEVDFDQTIFNFTGIMKA